MVSRFWVARNKDGKYLKQGCGKYGPYWACTDEIEAAVRYDRNSKGLAVHDIESYVKTHKKAKKEDFEIVCFIAAYRELKAEKAKEE